MLAALLVSIALLVATAAPAATLTEGSVAGGAFGGSWSAPTEVARGFQTITGTGRQSASDNLVFTGLPTGVRKLTFAAPQKIDWSCSAGGVVLHSDQPFRWGWDGCSTGSVRIDYYRRSKTLDLDLAIRSPASSTSP